MVREPLGCVSMENDLWILDRCKLTLYAYGRAGTVYVGDAMAGAPFESGLCIVGDGQTICLMKIPSKRWALKHKQQTTPVHMLPFSKVAHSPL